MNKKIAIIGAGISGLSTAYILSEKEQYDITILAKEFSPNITSNRAAAFWYPYQIRFDKRGIAWSKKSYDFFTRLAADALSGISMKHLIKVIRKDVVEEEPIWLEFVPKGVCTMVPDEQLASNVKKAYDVLVPLVETQIFLPYLQHIFSTRNVVFRQQEVRGFDELTSFDIIINCTGLGARNLCHDENIIPIRGQIVLLETDTSMPIYIDNETPLYIVPRKDAMIVGGTYERGIYNAITEPEALERILSNAYNIFPQLKKHKILGNWAGLRPYRPQVRVEHEAGTNIIHNYGHGGSGFTLSFGCASDVANLVEQIN
ncbi:FAD-dependent oxidoreductase [Parafilimonas sp.]|uniref:FAD-dependent oxidoreductase n=1 Tax=Parafilimonas sp. TaxID=1969739 RepID=UPI0039E5BD58